MTSKKPSNRRAAAKKQSVESMSKKAAKTSKGIKFGAQGGIRARAKRVGHDKALALYGKYYLESKAYGHDLRTDLGAAKAIEIGVPTDAVEEVIEAGVIEPGVLYKFVVPRRTLAYRKSKDQNLTSEESDRLARVLRVYARSEEALGDPERAYRWIRKPNRALNGKTPLELLSSEAGARAVEKVLGRIEHGVFS